jgi:hypothetical protein
MPDDGDDTDAFNRAMDANRPAVRRPVGLVLGGGVAPAIGAAPALWTDSGDWSEAAMPQRPWIVPGYLMRGSVTVLAGPGSAGKSSLMVGWAVAMALGQALGHFVPKEPQKVLLYNVEDDADEQRRRLSAALRPFGAAPRDIAGRIIRCGPSGVGTLLAQDQATGEFEATDAMAALDRLIAETNPDVVGLDPLVELHTADENDNTALRLVLAHLRDICRRRKCAVLLAHHTRKGAVAGDMDAIRGAGSIVGAGRAGYTVVPMTQDEAVELDIEIVHRRRFFRVDSAKGNYAPPTEAAWHELQEYELDNGETVAAVVPWAAPRANKEAAPEVLALIGADIERGTPGGPYSPRLAPDQPRSIAALLAQHGIQAPAAQKQVLKSLFARGYRVEEWRDGKRMPRSGIRGPNGLPAARWTVAEQPAPKMFDDV